MSTQLDSPVTDRLVSAIQELSLARDLGTIMQVVRRAARELTGADGATFVLKEGTCCFYADEDAIAPLWKGRRFPLSTCISGWVMTHRTPAVVPDIFQDPRIPIEAYRPTFVKSLAMVPIRAAAPIAAIGNYWARPHQPTERQLGLLQTLANSTSVAMENIELYADLERRVAARTRDLELANQQLAVVNQELEAFAYSVSHDLQAPVRAVKGFAGMLAEDGGPALSDEGRQHLARIDSAADRMTALIRDLLSLSRITASAVQRQRVDLAAIAREICHDLAQREPGRTLACEIAPDAWAGADPALVRIVLENLLGNAWKFTARTDRPKIEFGFAERGAMREFFVRDNGAGFPPEQVSKLFVPFQRLHAAQQFSGSGVGLATVRRIVLKHGGEVRAEGKTNHGATFFFTLPKV